MIPQFRSDWIAKALSLPAPSTGKQPEEFSSITTDSRKIQAGSLFVAITGEKFDGHTFIEGAVKAGATGIVAVKGLAPKTLPKTVLLFEVTDTTEAYRKIGGAWREFFQIPVIAVAGSVGKTTTKELLSAILRGKFSRVVSTRGSENGYLGIPMTLLEIRPDTDLAVVEVGIDEIGAMEKHIALVKPTAALLTAIGPEHLEKLIDLETVAKEEALALTLTAKAGGTAVVQLDDPWIKKIESSLSFSQNTWKCGFSHSLSGPRTLRGEWIESKDPEKTDQLRIQQENGATFEVSLPLLGRHNAGNCLVAVTMARALDLNPIEIQRGLSQFQGAYGRSEFRLLPRNTPVICDYYNANPTSVEAGLEVLVKVASTHSSREKFVVLGDMLELGTLEEKLHRDLSLKVREAHVDHLYLYGPRMKWLMDELKKSPFHGEVHHFSDHAALAAQFVSEFRLGDALLIKGSRGMRMEEVWKIIEPRLLEMSTA